MQNGKHLNSTENFLAGFIKKKKKKKKKKNGGGGHFLWVFFFQEIDLQISISLFHF